MSRLSLAQNNLGFWIDNSNVRIDIIATDYTNFAVCASCPSSFGSNVWILTRSLYVDALLKYRIETILNGINFSPKYLIETPFDSYTCDAASNKLNSLLAFSLVFYFLFEKILF